jgi:hypothetical protein
MAPPRCKPEGWRELQTGQRSFLRSGRGTPNPTAFPVAEGAALA